MEFKKYETGFYIRNTITVARDLIGSYLVSVTGEGRVIGRINETEAYIGAIDKACHAYPDKKTPRTAPLFKEGGIAYIYLIYGIYNCFNIVAEKKECAGAVLIRGAEIVNGMELAAQRRYNKTFETLSKKEISSLSDGPGKLCIAFDIDRKKNEISLTGDRIFVCSEAGSFKKQDTIIKASKRIGIDYAGEAKDYLWRFTG